MTDRPDDLDEVGPAPGPDAVAERDLADAESEPGPDAVAERDLADAESEPGPDAVAERDLADAESEPGPDAVAERGPALFSLDGRAVPALYLVGWAGTLGGLAAIVISFLGAGSAGSRWVLLGGLFVLALGLIAAAGSQAIERGRRSGLAYRGPSPVLAFAAVIALTLLLLVLVLGPLSALGLDARSPFATTLSLLLTTLVYVGVIRLVVVGPGALSWREMGLGQGAPAALRELAIGAALAVPVLVVTLVLGGVLSQFLAPTPPVLPPSGDPVGLLLNLMSAAILAPIGEELFFRGFTTTAWARVYGNRSAIVRGAIFFAFAHVATLFDASFAEGAQRALFSFLALLPAGIALGWVFLARRSLYAAIGLHSTFNAIQVVLLYLALSAG